MGISSRLDWDLIQAWLHDRKADFTGKKVYYGPNRGNAEWQAKGAFAWGCNAGCHGDGSGGFCRSLDEAQRQAGDHAKTHRGVRAFYQEG